LKKKVDKNRKSIIKKGRISHLKDINMMQDENSIFCISCHLQTQELYSITFRNIIKSFEAGYYKESYKDKFEGPKNGDNEDVYEKARKSALNPLFNDDVENQLIVLKSRQIPTIIIRAWGNVSVEKYE